jgi:xanthine dehydrogenase accessory factor
VKALKKLYSGIYEAVRSGEDVVMVSVIGESGSTPRGAGARMAVRKDGTSAGTIGGGAVEYRATHLAAEALEEKKSYVHGFRLRQNDIADLGMICGGDLEVFFQYIKGNSENEALFKEIIFQLDRDENSWLVTEIHDTDIWKMRISHDIAGPKEGKGIRYFEEPLTKAGKVCIFGGGHISQKLVPVLDSVGFRCVVIDDKPEFANEALFPKAQKAVVADFGNFGSRIEINPSDYVVILTRGHKNDYDVLAQALMTDACYIGLVGSRTKIGKTRERLAQDGFPVEAFDRVYAPIGTAIKAETPEEIAISIAGEMIRVRAELRSAKQH